MLLLFYFFLSFLFPFFLSYISSIVKSNPFYACPIKNFFRGQIKKSQTVGNAALDGKKIF